MYHLGLDLSKDEKGALVEEPINLGKLEELCIHHLCGTEGDALPHNHLLYCPIFVDDDAVLDWSAVCMGDDKCMTVKYCPYCGELLETDKDALIEIAKEFVSDDDLENIFKTVVQKSALEKLDYNDIRSLGLRDLDNKINPPKRVVV